MAKSPLSEENGTPDALNHKQAKKEVMTFLEAVAHQEKATDGVQAPDDPEFVRKYPRIFELCLGQRLNAAGRKWDRKGASVTWKFEPGLYRATITDNSLKIRCTVAAPTFDALWPALELAICDAKNWSKFGVRSANGLKEVTEKK